MRRLALLAVLVFACLAAGPGAASAAEPVCPPNVDVSVAIGDTVTVNGQCTDADGDETLSYGIDRGPTKGTFTGLSSTSVTYAPFPTQSEPLPTTDGFDYIVSDGTSTVTAHVTITITGVPGGNGSPVCPENEAYTEKNTTILLVNPCVDPEGVPTFGVGFTDPPFGTFSPTGNDRGNYTPDLDYVGDDGFNFTISDGTSQPTTSSIAIHVLAPGSTGPFQSAPEATPSEPVVAGVTLPSGAPLNVQVAEAPQTDPPPDGYFFLGTAFDIDAPAGTAANPLVLTFTIDGSQVISGVPVMIRDGVPVDQPCTGSGATPDPCFVPAADPVPGDDYTITIRSSHASRWNIGVRAARYDFEGDLGPATANAGRVIPLSFSLGGDEGLDVLEDGSPSSREVDCETGDPVGAESPVDSVGGGLRYEADGERYLYNWKTSKSWRGTCRELIIRLDDGTEHAGTFSFG